MQVVVCQNLSRPRQYMYNDAINENDKSMETIVKMANTAIEELR